MPQGLGKLLSADVDMVIWLALTAGFALGTDSSQDHLPALWILIKAKGTGLCSFWEPKDRGEGIGEKSDVSRIHL